MHRKRLALLQEQLRAKLKAQVTISDLLKAENREFEGEEEVNFDAIGAEILTIEASIAAIKKLIAVEDKVAEVQAPVTVTPTVVSPEAKAAERYSFMKVLRSVTEGKPLEGLEKEMHQEAEREVSASGQAIRGVGIPASMVNAKQRIIHTGDAASAGNLVDEAPARFFDALYPKTVIESLGATMIPGLAGNLPIKKGAEIATASFKAEYGEKHETNVSFERDVMTPHRLVGKIDISHQQLKQDSIGLESYIMSQLSSASRRAIDKSVFNGDGTGNDLLGILNTAGINEVTIAPTSGALTRADLIALYTIIESEDADENALNFLVTPGIKGYLQNLKTDAGSGNFVWPTNQQMNLLGYGAHRSNLLPKDLDDGGSNTGLHAMIFGDWSKMLVGSWGGFDVCMDNKTRFEYGEIKLAIASFWDMAVVHPKAFSVIKGINLA